MRRTRLVCTALAVTGLSFGAVACGDDSDEGGSGGGGESLDLVVGDSLPLSGDLADFGPPGEKAADLAIDEINAAIEEAGVDHTVEIVHEDNGGGADPQAAVSAARKLVDSDGASCIAGAWASSDTQPTAESLAIPEEIPLISPASTSAELTTIEDGTYFVSRTPPADNLQGPALANVIEDELGGAEGKVVAVAGRNDSYGEGLTGFFIDAWEAKGGEIAGGEALLYDPKAATYDAEAEEFTSEDPDAYVIVDFPETFAKFGPALARTGTWDPSITFVTDGLISPDLAADPQATDYTDGLRGTAPGTPTEGEASTAFDEAFDAAEPADVERATFDAQNFDAVVLCYLASVAAGSTDGADISETLQDVSGPGGEKYSWQELPQAIEALENGEDIDYVGASGEIDLDDNGDPTVGVYDVNLFKDGKVEAQGKQIPAEDVG